MLLYLLLMLLMVMFGLGLLLEHLFFLGQLFRMRRVGAHKVARLLLVIRVGRKSHRLAGGRLSGRRCSSDGGGGVCAVYLTAVVGRVYAAVK